MTDSEVDNAEKSAALMDGMVTLDELAEELKVSRSTLKRWHAQRIGPPRMKIGGRILFSIPAVRKWMLDQQEGGAPRPGMGR